LASESDSALRLEKVHAGYGVIPILHDVSLDIGADESVAIIGANGAGKSTLVRAVAGLLPLTSGEIRVGGVPIGRLAPHDRVRHGLGVVLESRALFGELTVRDNLELARIHGARSGRDARFSFDDVLELFPFMKQRLDAPVELLSGGEQQMVAIGRALLLQPQLLVMDEPSTGLAPKVLRHIVQTVEKLRSRGLAILLVEQNVALAAEIAQRGYLMSLGRVVDEIPPQKWSRIAHDESLLQAYLGA
jgi:branched-chain amino acid transport system ATP-binding protein